MAKIPIYMPKFGMTMTTGLITEWLFAEGERVEQGQPIALVETEKVQTELESPATGTLTDVRFQDGMEAPVGQVVAYVEDGA
ncbi:MAG: lipoyl domain-containing protein [Anaerolineae bacterium]|jgi:pyruvate/2-oxoglutarate dehydrogenase complex dihydrolipoamide acyltransferase (E2) component|nr:lipoyl domain-containing protein [Anaerolineae bacterium]